MIRAGRSASALSSRPSPVTRLLRWTGPFALVTLLIGSGLALAAPAPVPGFAAPVASGISPARLPSGAFHAPPHPGSHSPASTGCTGPSCPGTQTAIGSSTTRSLVPGAVNAVVTNWTTSSQAVVNPYVPSNLVVAGMSDEALTTLVNGSNSSGGFAAVSTSFDGGISWLRQWLPPDPEWSNASSPACGQAFVGFPSVAFGSDSRVYVASLVEASWVPPQSCRSVSYTNSSVDVSVSADGGRTWSGPKVVAYSNDGASYWGPAIGADPVSGRVWVMTTGYSVSDLQYEVCTWSSPGDLSAWSRMAVISRAASWSQTPTQIAVDPWGGVDALIYDARGYVEFSRAAPASYNFSAPSVVASPGVWQFSSGMLSPVGGTLAVDRSPTSPYRGTVYVAWTQPSDFSGQSEQMELIRSGDNGTNWSSPVSLNGGSSGTRIDPAVGLGADGSVYTAWYRVYASGYDYRTVAAVSHDGGVTFSAETPVATAGSKLARTDGGSAVWGQWIGPPSLIEVPGGVVVLWPDARTTTFAPVNFYSSGVMQNLSLYSARLTNATVTATVSTNISVTATGLASVAVAAGPSVTTVPFIAGGVYNLTASAWVSWNGSSWSFAYWFGVDPVGRLLYGTGVSWVGSMEPGTHLTACYVQATEATCNAPGAPGFLSWSVQPSASSVRVNGDPQPSASSVPHPLLPGNAWLNASDPGYVPGSIRTTIEPGATSSIDLQLDLVPGDLVGSVAPSSARVSVDGAFVPVGADGVFALTLPPGSHSVAATARDYFGYLNSSVTVGTQAVTLLDIVLAPEPGSVYGSVYPTTATVTVNDVPVLLDTGGWFSLSVGVGTYWVNASAPGYASASTGPLLVGPHGSVPVALSLQDLRGLLMGAATPATAWVTLDGGTLATENGRFSTWLLPGIHILNALAPGFDPVVLPITIHPRGTVVVRVALNLSVGWIVGHVSPVIATVLLDGQPVAVGAYGSFNVSAIPGPHQLEAYALGFVASDLAIQVDAGRAAAATVSLLPLVSNGVTLGSNGQGGGLTGRSTPPILTVGILLLLFGAAYALWPRRRRPRTYVPVERRRTFQMTSKGHRRAHPCSSFER